jgi:hypothetical protein
VESLGGVSTQCSDQTNTLSATPKSVEVIEHQVEVA